LCCFAVGFFLIIASLTKSKYYFYIRVVNIVGKKYNEFANPAKLCHFGNIFSVGNLFTSQVSISGSKLFAVNLLANATTNPPAYNSKYLY